MSYQKMMKWNKRHRKGTKQTCIMHTESGWTPSVSYLDSYFEYRSTCELNKVEPKDCKEYYYNGDDRERNFSKELTESDLTIF